MPTFFAFWDRAAGLPLDEQVARFESDVVAAWPALYAPNVLGLRGDVRAVLRQRIAAWLPTLPPVMDQLRVLHARFANDVDAATSRLATALPDFSWQGACYAFASIDGMNGGVRDVDGKASLVFGLDVVAKNPTAMPLPVLFAHELFHVHHAAVMVSPPVSMCIADALWSEGLATFASTLLVPGTSDGQALPMSHLHDPAQPALDAPERRVALDDVMPALASSLGGELRASLLSEDGDVYSTFFLGRAGSALGRRPVRSGYWFGLAVARRLARDRTLAELSRLSSAELRGKIGLALDDVIAER